MRKFTLTDENTPEIDIIDTQTIFENDEVVLEKFTLKKDGRNLETIEAGLKNTLGDIYDFITLKEYELKNNLKILRYK